MAVEKVNASPRVELTTSKGKIVIELDAAKAPITVKNFLTYVNEGFYTDTVFHRVIPGFMIQGGGMTADMNQKQNHAPIAIESGNGLKNMRGTLAMARTNDPNSATSQFFINTVDNDFLNYKNASNPGYAVFAKVVEGMAVVDAIEKAKTKNVGGHSDVPAEPITILSAKEIK
jgi:cyclophilin family peptidyl-prolyl cis-trans isomerase